MRGSGRPVWDDLASPDDLAALDPGVPPDFDATPDVLVVGGGVIGLAVAFFCRRAGMRVLIVERDRLAGCASGRAAGGLSPDVHPDLGDAWQTLARESLELHRRLDAELGFGLRPRDVLIPPDLRIANQAHVDPLRLAAALASEAGVVATGTECEYTLTSGGRVVTAVTSSGNVHPDAVVFATGLAPPQVPSVRQQWVKGHLIATEPAPFVVDEIVTDGDILVVQLPDGSLVAGGTKDRNDSSDTVDAAVVSGVVQLSSSLVPQTNGLAITHEWCCFRPSFPDERPVVDRVPGLSNAWFAAGFYSTGLLMAPAVGSLLAEWIGGERPRALESMALDQAAS